MFYSVRKAQISVFGVGFFFLAVAISFLAIRILRGIGSFQLTHYHFNYSDEFLRRGFIGEVLRLLGVPLTNFSVSLLYSAAVVLFILVLISACSRVFADQSRRAGVLFVAFMVACPGLTLHYAYSSYGYLDIYQLLLAVFGLWIIRNASLPTASLVALCFSAMSILIHEAGLLTTAPILITALVLKFPQWTTLSQAAKLFAVPLALTICVWSFGSADVLSYDAHIAALQAQAASPNDISDAAVLVLHRTLGDNIGLVLPRSVWWYVWQKIKFVVFAAPYLIFFALTLRAAYFYLRDRNQALGAIAMPIAILIPVALYPIGHDYFRWWSTAMTNYFMLTLFVCSLHKGYLDTLVEILDRQKKMVLAGIAVGITMGGIGGLLSFSIHTAPAAIAYRVLF